MAQQLSQKVVNTFIKGLITEAGELTFPPDASVDELNCDLRRDGSRRRRQGADIEFNNTLSSWTVSDSDIVNTGEWLNVGGQTGLQYLVVQKGSILYFYNKESTPFSADVVAGSVDLSSYEHATSSGAGTAEAQFTSIKGSLVVVSSAIDPIYIQRDNVSGTITVTQIDFRVRDFKWQKPRSIYTRTANASSVSLGREYDTANTGWSGDNGAAALSTYIASDSKYPPLTHPWYSGKDSSGLFDVAEWEKVYSGTTLIGNGKYILDFFNKDRSTASGVVGLTTETESSRFTSVETFGDRVFYAGLDSATNGSTVLFSRIIDEVTDLGECLQQNDPTSEEISDLLPTDGGVIRIAGCVGIKKLYNLGSTIYIFADNGVWAINGVDNVFRASEYSISKISDVGIVDKDSFLEAEGVPFWWSRSGIHTMRFEESSGRAQEQNISIGTIQTYWDGIPNASKIKVKGVYDKINKVIYWAWPDITETVESKLNNFLLLNIPLQAFYPWRIGDQEANSSCVVGLSFYEGFGAGDVALDVITAVGDDVITSLGDDVVSTQLNDFATGDPAIVLLIRDGATNKFTMGAFNNSSFLDWSDANYTSFAEAGYEFMGDLILQKNAPFVATYMRVTETGWAGNDTTGYDPTDPSGLLMSAFWDFKSSPSGAAQQVYRFKQIPVVDETALAQFNYPSTVITTRTKLRGRGRSMKLRFESEQGKDFVLLGYSVLGARNARF